MSVDVPIRCSCGTLRGFVRDVSGRGKRLVCYCDDCQSFAHFLGRADEVLDAHGGTDVFLTTLAHLEINEGGDQVACVRLTANGKLRWYSACCKTPIANTMSTPRSPFISVIHSCMDHTADVHVRDKVLGPIRTRVQGRFAKGDLSNLDAHPRIPMSMFPLVVQLLFAKLRGEYSPSPFFDDATGKFRVVPRVLSDVELRHVTDSSASWTADPRG